jgi:heme exporter protein D
MQFDSFADFIDMGGHGLYVWLAYGTAFVAFAASYFSVRQAAARQREALRWQANASNSQERP